MKFTYAESETESPEARAFFQNKERKNPYKAKDICLASKEEEILGLRKLVPKIRTPSYCLKLYDP